MVAEIFPQISVAILSQSMLASAVVWLTAAVKRRSSASDRAWKVRSLASLDREDHLEQLEVGLHLLIA